MVGPDSEADSAMMDGAHPSESAAVDAVPIANAPAALNSHLLAAKLGDAELLLNHAVETGVHVDEKVVRAILEAGAAVRTGWTEQAATNLLLAVATLAEILKPVSAESLQNTKKYRSQTRGRRLLLPITMGLLAALIVIYSATAFLFSTLSTSILTNLNIANPLAVKLSSELGESQSPPDPGLCLNDAVTARPSPGLTNPDPSIPPAGITRKDVIEDLQAFASAIRDMYGDARRMNRFYHSGWAEPSSDPFNFSFGPPTPTAPDKVTKMLELPPGLPNLALAATERVCVYQRARYYAQRAEENATILTGAVATYILPVLYAILGAGAYILRRLESRLRSNTFISEAHSPRFMTAAIAGSVVGLFNFGQGVSVSPLAIAFLAGYAVDVFFTFLEGLMQTLSKPRENPPGDRSPPAAKT
jgi:hypothetical protein